MKSWPPLLACSFTISSMAGVRDGTEVHSSLTASESLRLLRQSYILHVMNLRTEKGFCDKEDARLFATRNVALFYIFAL